MKKNVFYKHLFGLKITLFASLIKREAFLFFLHSITNDINIQSFQHKSIFSPKGLCHLHIRFRGILVFAIH